MKTVLMTQPTPIQVRGCPVMSRQTKTGFETDGGVIQEVVASQGSSSEGDGEHRRAPARFRSAAEHARDFRVAYFTNELRIRELYPFAKATIDLNGVSSFRACREATLLRPHGQI